MSAERRVELRLHNSVKSYTRGEVCAHHRRIHYADDDFSVSYVVCAEVAAHLMLCECHASVACAATVLAVRDVQSGTFLLSQSSHSPSTQQAALRYVLMPQSPFHCHST